MKNNKHRYIVTRNLRELDLTMLEKTDYKIEVTREMAPIYTIQNAKVNGYEKTTNFITLNNYKISEEEIYDNIYFKDFVLTDCRIVYIQDECIKRTFITFEKITLV